MISPSGRVSKQAPDWFFVAIEACGSGTSDLGLFLMVSLFIGFLASVSREDGPRGEHNPPGHGQGPRRAPVSCALLLHLLVLPRSFRGPFCSKRSSKSFNSFGELPFLHKKTAR